MMAFATRLQLLFRNSHRSEGWAAILCGCLLMAAGCRPGSGLAAVGGAGGGRSMAAANGAVTDPNGLAAGNSGPTILLSYSEEECQENPLAGFLYFVPLIAPMHVDHLSSANNDQRVRLVSHRFTQGSDWFRVDCEFKITGTGFHTYSFDPAGMIAERVTERKRGKPLTNLLDYIRFDGEGYGMIVAKGVRSGFDRTVTSVDMQFNGRGQLSPVTIGLYDIKPNAGEYRYENRSNEAVARVNSLAFRRSATPPRMGIKLASIIRNAGAEGFWSRTQGALANLLIDSPKVEERGNAAMLEMGEALSRKSPTFTFPKAGPLQDDRPASSHSYTDDKEQDA